ncbi:hypothetical protein GCM10010965_24500 [Caldalkalibacillus thermarum]|nr:hypothetical protein GCM10010965_24500 [Caldalkalibacillus thermarum]
MWTGVQVYIIERYKSGQKALESIYSGTINWYWLAIPLCFLTPMIGIMTPLLPVALSLTLLLTGFACAYVAMAMVDNNVARGMALAIGMITALQGPAWGLGIGILLYLLLIGFRSEDNLSLIRNEDKTTEESSHVSS